uniref:succinate dehydrogenase, cytochrome b556 subunit n=1 Tax=Candidatus Limnocylindrus sp. TaxID=2802978 RepID=UPI00404B95CD
MSRETGPLASPQKLRNYPSYRGGEGMAAWAFHRISGIGVWLFIILHIIDIWLIGVNPELYDYLGQIYSSPPGRVMETLLGAALFYHALNGMRIVVMDFWPALTVYHRQMWRIVWIVFFAIGLPGAYIILKPIWEAVG